jgi:hypothetical protein
MSPETAPTERPDPPPGANDLVVVVLDSLRYDSWVVAQPPVLGRLGEVERRWSYASWTAPSHYNLLTGLLPHASPTHVYASDLYKDEFERYALRLGVAGVEFKSLLPSLYLPTFLRNHLGYETHARVSMPVLNPYTTVNRDFDSYRLMPSHNDFGAIIDELRFGDRPSFWLLNVGETHYPYALAGEDSSEWPRLSGLHGVLKRLDENDPSTAFFDEERMAQLRRRQIAALLGVDRLFERLYDALPPKTWIVVTSDHGELFGEDGYFGHGPIAHEKVFEVPLVEGRIR